MKKNTELKRMMVVSNSFLKISGISNSMSNTNAYDMIAVIANCAFSIEISQKCLYYADYNNKITWTHDIQFLYDSVKQSGLEQYLLKFLPRSNITKITKELSNAFEDFRYIYESKKSLKITPSLMKYFTILINKYSNKYVNSLKN